MKRDFSEKKKNTQMLNKHMKDVLSFIRESKPLWDTTSHPLGWLIKKSDNSNLVKKM